MTQPVSIAFLRLYRRRLKVLHTAFRIKNSQCQFTESLQGYCAMAIKGGGKFRAIPVKLKFSYVNNLEHLAGSSKLLPA